MREKDNPKLMCTVDECTTCLRSVLSGRRNCISRRLSGYYLSVCGATNRGL